MLATSSIRLDTAIEFGRLMDNRGSVSETREGISTSETIGRLAKARRWFWRPRMIIPVAAVALVLVSAGVHYLFDDGMSGPHGPFPRPVAAQAPARSPQRVATAEEGPGGIQIYGGVAITSDLWRQDMGVRAVGIATGKTYWEYHKQERAEPIGLDHATGDVYIDGDHDLVKINVRTGRIRWSKPTPGDFPFEHAIVSDTGTRTLVIFNDSSSSERGGEIIGIDAVTGRTRWTSSHSCDARTGTTAVVGGILALTCGDLDNSVHGIDLATGKQRWHEGFSRLFPEKPRDDYSPDDFSVLDAGQGRLAVTTSRIANTTNRRSDTIKGGFALLDATTGKILQHRVTKKEIPVAFSGGMWLSTCALGKTEGVCATDTGTGKRLWSSPSPGRQETWPPNHPYATVANGRVYSFFETADSHQHGLNQIVVSDLRTGKLLTYWTFPGLTPLRHNFAITDGVVIVHPGGFDSDADLYADRPDLHRTRDLFPE